MLDHDTPIKGHKIKYLSQFANRRSSQEQLISQLAEQHFAPINLGASTVTTTASARVTVPDNRTAVSSLPSRTTATAAVFSANRRSPPSSVNLNSRIIVDAGSSRRQASVGGLLSRNARSDDHDESASSGLENSQHDDERQQTNRAQKASLSLSPTENHNKNQSTNQQQQQQQQRNTSSNKLSTSYSLLNDDSLNRLRQKQRDMLFARKLLATASSHRLSSIMNHNNNNNNNGDETNATAAGVGASMVTSGVGNALLDHLNNTSSAR